MPGVEYKEPETSVHHEFRKREAKRQKESAAPQDIVEEWFEIIPDKRHAKGGKVVLCKKTKSGTSRQYCGRELEKPEFMAQLKASGKLRA